MLRKRIATAMLLLSAASGPALASCLDVSPVVFVPAEIVKELCFARHIDNVKAGSSGEFIIKVEPAASIPSNYAIQGIKGVISVRARKPGLITNMFVLTDDGRQTEIFLVSTTSAADTTNLVE